MPLLVSQETVDRLSSDAELPGDPGCATPKPEQAARRIAAALPSHTSLRREAL